jgi:putative nucleotidyltransferase with HDIG domain
MMPQIMVQLLDLYGRENVNLFDVAALISQDAALTDRVISVASSASHYGQNKPSSLDQCLSLLGMSAIKTIAINESILQVFRRFTREKDFDLRRFWEDSLRSALIARDLAKAMGYPNREEAYLGGLMHDVGQLAMLATDADAYYPVLYAFDDHEPLCSKEKEAFDLTHAEVGAWLVEKWQFNPLLSDAILYHHDPVERIVQANALVRIVYLASRFSALRNSVPEQADLDLARLCGACSVDLPRVLETKRKEVSEFALQLGIELIDRPSLGAADSYYVLG